MAKREIAVKKYVVKLSAEERKRLETVILKTAVDRREASGFCDFARSGCIRLARAMAGPGAGGH